MLMNEKKGKKFNTEIMNYFQSRGFTTSTSE